MEAPQPYDLTQDAFRRSLVRHISIPLVLAIISSLIFIGLVLYLQSVNGLIAHSEDIITKSNKVSKLLVDAETSLRAYSLTGLDEFLAPYQTANANFPEAWDDFTAITASNPDYQIRLKRFQNLFDRWQQFAQQIILLRHEENGLAAIVELARVGDGKKLMDEMRLLLRSLREVEDSQRKARSKAANTTIFWLTSLTMATGVISGVVLALVGRRQMLKLANVYGATLELQQDQNNRLAREAWLATGKTRLATLLVGEQSMIELCEKVLNSLVSYLGASVGAVYISDDGINFHPTAHYAHPPAKLFPLSNFKLHETLAGQAAAINQVMQLKHLPANYLPVCSALGSSLPHQLLIIPTCDSKRVNAVIELGFLGDLPDQGLEFANQITFKIGKAVEALQYRLRLQEVLLESQRLNEELRAQQEELRATNEELEEQSHTLLDSQARLQIQQQALEQSNQRLEEQSATLNERNEALKQAHSHLESRAAEIQRASRYKSEFLANMSHELRTPLNSTLILAKLLAENRKGNLSPDQVQFAESIYTSGNDLLHLINDILDLSKVEAGKLDIQWSNVKLPALLDDLKQLFFPIATEKQLSLNLQLLPDTPTTIFSDAARLMQILKNLLANALKFTEHGSVQLQVSIPSDGFLAFAVSDNGIGIAPEHQESIFEAFRQAENGTTRRYGGTGLGLSISRNLARMLGGQITLHSQLGVGSTFTLTLPVTPPGMQPGGLIDQSLSSLPSSTATEVINTPAPAQKHTTPLDDSAILPENGRQILVIEDHPQFARSLYELAHERGFYCLLADTASDGLAMAKTYLPQAILLDIKLPDYSGLILLEQFKQDPATRHIPVHVISGTDSSEPALQLGAIGHVRKPADADTLRVVFSRLETRLAQTIQYVLVVEDDPLQADSIRRLIEDSSVKVQTTALAEEALTLLRNKLFDCMVVDLTLPDMAGHELLKCMAQENICSFPPVIVYTGRDLSAEEEAELRHYARAIIIKGARSPERLLDEITLFLHQVEHTLAPERQHLLQQARQDDEQSLKGRTLLLVDDDVRNVFALSSALEALDAKVIIARNGAEALEKLDSDRSISLVLMDIMMPIMDGYEAMRQIRLRPHFAALPILALTARAMQDDHDQCLAAGANDYLSKPVQIDKLLSLIRVWSPHSART
ncbi:response regulator [Chitinimonas sp. BJB300]|uniref:response regulator n=1 Tax=Chitinimonas sp. BJB300 TaxID=1559339 RepID=UPI000C0FCEF9|nr:response regulator [Chitinimonas sp. BJB300]PHV11819.1 two-component system sensor histidine kinase/response regulator [Chitinimonas sp. BJB300]TSJ87030.1 response regulator [Chitinimonas sp. BJB300]